MPYIYFRKEFSARKWIYSEPISIPKEKVFLLKNLINIYLTDLNYSKEELASNLGLNLHEFSNIYFDRQTLRLVSRKLRFDKYNFRFVSWGLSNSLNVSFPMAH
ncbi:hypothetical protein B2G51_10730 [Leptospira santarosai]|nr:hypothetical protein B2G51_10730 [Leptospira santarosai]